MILCILEGVCIKTVLCDFGASINLIPVFIIRKFGLTGEVKSIRICLQFVNGFIKYLSGIIEDMIVKVGLFVFFTDFVVRE
ncbi:hypothetical protein C1T30_43005, partial [Bacillus sp. MBGLi97]